MDLTEEEGGVRLWMDVKRQGQEKEGDCIRWSKIGEGA